MEKYIRVPLTEEMERDYRECAEMMDNGQEKNCEGCSLNGGTSSNAWESFRGAWMIGRADHLWRKRYMHGGSEWDYVSIAGKKGLSRDM